MTPACIISGTMKVVAKCPFCGSECQVKKGATKPVWVTPTEAVKARDEEKNSSPAKPPKPPKEKPADPPAPAKPAEEKPAGEDW